MNLLAHFVMMSWIPVVQVIFASMTNKRRAVIATYLVAWLFLPFAGYRLPSLPDYTKFSATNFSVLLGMLLFDSGRLLGFRPRWYDIPIIVWCVCPFISSVVNGLGPYDGLSAMAHKFIIWGCPYLVGRLYFCDREGLEDLGRGMFLAAVCYVPLILIESRLSAQIHKWVYGIPTRASFSQIEIFGPLRWKPSVFMDSALAVTMFMGSATLVGMWMLVIGRVKRYRGVAMGWPVLAVGVGAILSKSLGSLALTTGGIGIMYALKAMRKPVPILCLLFVSPTYMLVRATDLWSGQELVQFVASNISEQKSRSLEFRMRNEDLLKVKALQQPWFGWGGWGRGRVYAEGGKDISVTDGLWIIALSENGILGLASLYTVMLLPAVVLLIRQPRALWTDPGYACVVAFTVVLLLYSIDCLMNAMVNPIFFAAAGGLLAMPRRSVRPTRLPRPQKVAPRRPPATRPVALDTR